MKRTPLPLTITLLLALLAPAFSTAAGSLHVHGYYRSNGTYVAPYTRNSHSSSAVPWVERDSRGRICR